MARFEAWEVAKVPFPYTDRPVKQHRPALVIARQATPGSSALVWVLMITSAHHRRWAGDVDVSDLGLAGLPAPSMIRTAKIATVDESVAERLGILPPADRALVQGHLARALATALAQ